jgi:catechol 2,3-dioxygenase-like lactoylglutathione lyase family enzyme
MIQHVTRHVPPSELQPCVDFYEVLGFESVPVPPGIADRALWLERRGTQIHLMPVPDAGPVTGHVGVVVEAYEDTVDQLRQGGHEVEPRAEHWGSPRAYVHDPAGNLVELMAWAPGSRGRVLDDAGRPT